MIGTAILVSAALCMSALLIIDLRSHRLPDPLNLLLGLLGLGFHFLHDFNLIPLASLLTGAILGALLLYGLRFVWLRRRGIEALGLGDVKFIAASGLWVGIDGIFLGIALGAALSLVGLVLLRAVRTGQLAWPSGDTRLPFGPGLVLATVIVFLWQVWPGLPA